MHQQCGCFFGGEGVTFRADCFNTEIAALCLLGMESSGQVFQFLSGDFQLKR